MAATLLSTQQSAHPLPYFSYSSGSKIGLLPWRLEFGIVWPPIINNNKKRIRVVKVSSVMDILSPLSLPDDVYLLADNAAGYSLASYYTSLGLFVISVPGLWSLIKRSVKSKIVQKTYIGEGEGKKVPNQVAGEILSFFTRNNFVVLDRGETITCVYIKLIYSNLSSFLIFNTKKKIKITGCVCLELRFEGVMLPSRGKAALLTFCTCISLASVALVLTITFPQVGNNWFFLTILSPLAGLYYWKRASRKKQIKVKMIVAEDGTLSEIVVQGDDQ